MTVPVRVDRTSIANYLKGEELNIMRNKAMTAMFTERGRTVMDQSGKKLNWKIRTVVKALSEYTESSGVGFGRTNRHEEAELDWGAYVISDSITKMEKLANRGREAIVNYASNLMEMLVDDFKDGFNAVFYQDGTGTDGLHGFLTWLGVTGSDQYTAPSDSYAGQSTALGGLGGSLTAGTWPDGQFEPEYYAWSPLVVNYSHASWAGGATWADNCIQALRNGIIFQSNLKGKQGNLDLIVMTASMYTDFLDNLDEKERVHIERNGAKAGLVDIGFPMVRFQGVDITHEYDCPSTQAFGINFKELQLHSMQKQLFVPGTGKDHSTFSDTLSVDFYGQLKGNPRATVLWDNVT